MSIIVVTVTNYWSAFDAQFTYESVKVNSQFSMLFLKMALLAGSSVLKDKMQQWAVNRSDPSECVQHFFFTQ